MGRMSILSPAVTQLLDDLGEAALDSESEEGSLLEREDTRDPGELTKATDAPKSRRDYGLTTIKLVYSSLSPARAEESGSSKLRLKPKQPYMARFYSLRSMLFSNTIEDKIKSITYEDSNKEEAAAEKWKNEESIDYSDVEDLVRWVSRRDLPSDGEIRASKTPAITLIGANDSHDSLGDSDVDELVQWASRKSLDLETKQSRCIGYSDALTESDSELINEDDSSEDEDADDLVCWVSYCDGLSAVSSLHPRKSLDAPKEPERGCPRSCEGPASLRLKPKGYITHEDIGDLVKWSPTKVQEEEEEEEKLLREEEKKKQQLGMSVDEGSLLHGDVQEIIEHVRSSSLVKDKPEVGDLKGFRTGERGVKEDAASDYLAENRAGIRQIENGEGGKERGTRERNSSLGHEDVDELVKWISWKG
ncbi:hypothetical protein HBI40_247410 [Parastagonospora nodorum]|nr:hypothetical protein HBI41_257730 [Parastagonospora nodorum]KAH6259331.1 hypothetical protein HBI40_247410 [Parastagonospora nodorum]